MQIHIKASCNVRTVSISATYWDTTHTFENMSWVTTSESSQWHTMSALDDPAGFNLDINIIYERPLTDHLALDSHLSVSEQCTYCPNSSNWRFRRDPGYHSQTSGLYLNHSLLHSLPNFLYPSFHAISFFCFWPRGGMKCRSQQLFDVRF